MAATVSVSKGVFAFKRRQNKEKDFESLSSKDYWVGDDEDNIKELTHKNYTICWEAVTKILNDLQSNIHAKVFQELIEFVREAGERFSSEPVYDIPTACLVTGVNMPDHNSIFASLVRLLAKGVSPHIARLHSRDCTTVKGVVYKMISQLMGDGEMLDPELGEEVSSGPGVKRAQCTMSVLTAWYQELINLKKEKTTLVKHISPKLSARTPQKVLESPTKSMQSPRKSPRKALQSPRKALLDSPRKAALESPRKALQSPRKALLDSPRKALQSPRKALLDSPRKGLQSPSTSAQSPHTASNTPLKSLGSPTASHHSPEMPPTKKMKKGDKPSAASSRIKPLIVILEDVESFSHNVLNDLILICSEYKKEVPIVLVFGVATTSGAVHRSLSQDASSCVAMEVFQAQPSTHYLTHVIQEVLMSDKVPFHLGGRPFKLLLDIFLYNDLSVEKFVKGLKVCMLEHFLGNPASLLCCSASRRPSAIRFLKPSQMDMIRNLPSFRAYVEKCPLLERPVLLLDEKETKATISSLLKDLDCWYGRFCLLVKVVRTLTSTLPHCPLGRQVREVLATCLSQPLVETEEYQEASKLLKLLAREELLNILNQILVFLLEHTADEVVYEFHDKLSLLVAQLSSLDQLEQVAEETVTTDTQEKPLKLRSSDRFNLKEKLLEMNKKKSKKTNVYDDLRSEVLEFLTTTFREHLQPPSSQPLHEVMFLQASSGVKRLLVGLPRPALTTALTNPHHYLQCDCCQLEEPSSLVSSMPDLSVAYKLHLECGRMVNLFDWLQAFVSVVNGVNDDDNMTQAVDDKLQARFVQAVSEMQFLGFVKPTKRKTDHVARLTWGGC